MSNALHRESAMIIIIGCPIFNQLYHPPCFKNPVVQTNNQNQTHIKHCGILRTKIASLSICILSDLILKFLHITELQHSIYCTKYVSYLILLLKRFPPFLLLPRVHLKNPVAVSDVLLSVAVCAWQWGTLFFHFRASQRSTESFDCATMAKITGGNDTPLDKFLILIMFKN